MNLKLHSNAFKEILDNTDTAVIVSHENPDGDAVGSALALKLMLQKLDKKATIWLPGNFPGYYKWLPDSDSINFFSTSSNHLQESLNTANLLIAVDISTLSRTGDMAEQLMAFKGKKVLIDHHIGPEASEFDFIYSNVTVSSTAELIFHLFLELDVVELIDVPIAEAIYTGIMTDTGSFSFNCNSAQTYEVVSELIKSGVIVDRIHKLVYDNNTENRIRLLGYALNKMEVLPEYHTAYIALNKQELEDSKSQIGDTEGIVNYALSIKGVILAAFFSFRDGEVKISFRSKGNFPVNEFASNHFNGGGHKNAAGGTYNGPIEEAVSQFISLLPQYRLNLKSNELS